VIMRMESSIKEEIGEEILRIQVKEYKNVNKIEESLSYEKK